MEKTNPINPVSRYYENIGLSADPHTQLNSQFKLSLGQFAELNEWLSGVEKRAAAIQREQYSVQDRVLPDALPYYGALGGGLEFSFVPNGFGVCVSVREVITGESIDLTEMDNW